VKISIAASRDSSRPAYLYSSRWWRTDIMTSLNSCLSFGHFIFVDSWPWNCLACCCRRRVQGSIPFWLAILVSHAKIAGQLPILYIKHCLVGGFDPSEKYVSQIGSSSQLLGKIIQMFQTTNQVYIVLTIWLLGSQVYIISYIPLFYSIIFLMNPIHLKYHTYIPLSMISYIPYIVSYHISHFILMNIPIPLYSINILN